MKTNTYTQTPAVTHTPTPWEINYGGARHGIKDSLGNQVCDLHQPFYRRGDCQDAHEAIMKANAEIIVRAVNSHAALVDACQAILDCNCDDQPEDWGSVEWCEWVGQAIDQARTALAAAKGVQS